MQSNEELIDLDRSINRRATLISSYGIAFIAPTILLSLSLYFYYGRNVYESSVVSEGLNITIIVLTFILIVSLFIIMSADITSKIARLPRSEEQKQQKLFVSLRIITVIFTAYLYIFLLEQGYLDSLANYLKMNVFPALSDGINYVLSNLIGWAISGAIGNLFYDLMKRLVIRRKHQAKTQ